MNYLINAFGLTPEVCFVVLFGVFITYCLKKLLDSINDLKEQLVVLQKSNKELKRECRELARTECSRFFSHIDRDPDQERKLVAGMAELTNLLLALEQRDIDLKAESNCSSCSSCRSGGEF